MVVVEPPDSRGLRDISIGGTKVGSAWSLRDLRKVLTHHGCPRDMDVEDRASVHWREADSGTWPDRAWRRRTTMALMTAGLLGSMTLLFVVGSPDVVGALTFAGRITGVLLILLGGVEGLAALAVLDYWGKRRLKFSGAVVLIGALIALAINGLLLFLWFQEREYTRYLFAYPPLWCWSLWALWVLIHEEAWRGTPHPKRFAAGVAATTLLAAVNLSYSAVYQPVSAAVLFDLEVKFGKARIDAELDTIHLPLTLQVKNAGKVPAYIISDNYSVVGLRADLSDGAGGLRGWESAMKAEHDVALFTGLPERYTISTGLFYGPGSWLAPGEEYTEEKLVQLPRSARYDAIQADLTVELMRKDRGKVDLEEFKVAHPSWDARQGAFYCPVKKCGQYVAYRSRLRHNNNIINVTRRPVYVTSLWGVTPFDSRSAAFISSSPDFIPESLDEAIGAEKENKREKGRYGVSAVDAQAIVSFVELLNSPAA
ncbi:Yip1 family protein [Streptomyces sp. NPDC002867]